MTRVLLVSALLLAAGQAFADDIGSTWFDGLKTGRAATAAKVTVVKDLKYGDSGTDTVVKEKVDATLAKAFPKMRKAFAKSPIEKVDCTRAGRELGFMSEEWKDKNPSVSEWIHKIPDALCTSNAPEPPEVWLVKAHDDMPHALVLFRTGTDELVDAVYTF